MLNEGMHFTVQELLYIQMVKIQSKHPNIILGLTYVCHMTESKTDTNRCTYSCKNKIIFKKTE